MAVREKISGVERARVPILGVRALGLYQEGTSWCPAIQVVLHLVLVCPSHPKNTWLEGGFLRYFFPDFSWVRVPDSGTRGRNPGAKCAKVCVEGHNQESLSAFEASSHSRGKACVPVLGAVQQCGTESVPASPARSWGMYLKLPL